MSKKAFVSGCFDLLHSGHVAFFQEAAQYGDLYVAIGSDLNIFRLKNRPTINNQDERLYMIKALACVHSVFVAKGSGILDFVDELKEIKPDYFVVNEDGSTPAKKKLCEDLGIEYVILKRIPHPGLDVRSTTALRGFSTIPYALELIRPALPASEPSFGLTVSIHHQPELSSKVREAALELWGARLPADQPEKLAKILFGYFHQPGTTENINPQPAIGMTFPGLTRADYASGYWPVSLSTIQEDGILSFLESCIYLKPLTPAQAGILLPRTAPVTQARAKFQAETAKAVWNAILARDATALGRRLREDFESQLATAPHFLVDSTREQLEAYRQHVLGWSISGESLVLVSEKPMADALRISIRRASD